jgi:hypothetical protein
LNQLGGQQTSTNTGGATPGNISVMTLSSGTWIIFANAGFPGITYKELSITTTSGASDAFSRIAVNSDGPLFLSRGITVASGTQTYYLYANSTPSITPGNVSFYAIRVG